MPENLQYNEKELFQRIAESDEFAFELFYAYTRKASAAYAYKIVRSWDVVEEILQESLIRLWLYRDKLADIDYPTTYFFRMVANECARYLSRHGFTENRKKSYEGLVSQASTIVVNQTELDISYRETQRIIRRVVDSLPPQRRTIYQLSREEGLTLPEIAEKLGVSRDYVKKALMVALQAIREKLTEEDRLIFLLIFLLS